MRSSNWIAPIVLLAVGVGGSSAASPIFYGPTPYLSSADIPVGFYGGGSPTALEDFEDASLDFGITASSGFIAGPATYTDSVDGDDGSIDGLGTAGHSYGMVNAAQVTFTFSSLVTAAALVFTDAHWDAAISFEAFGPGMVSLGVLGPYTDPPDGFPDGITWGSTAEDRFFGVQDPDGILAIRMSTTIFGPNDGVELDHVQYGVIPEPEPSLLIGAGLAALALVRRRSRSGR
jgi:hypothetical protein